MDQLPGTNDLVSFIKLKRAFILMTWDHPNQSQVHPFFSLRGISLQNADFQILRKNRKSHYYGNFCSKQGSDNSIEVKYES